MQRQKLSPNSDDEEEIQMDDKLSEEVEQIGRSNSGSTQVYQKNGFDKINPLQQKPLQDENQSKKNPQVISLQLSNSPNGNKVKQSNEDGQTKHQTTQHESVTLTEKLLHIFTNVGTKTNQPKQGGQPKSYALQLEDNLIETKGKKGEVHHFKIDNDMDMFEDEQQENEKEKQDNAEEEQKKNGGLLLFENDEDIHPDIEIGNNSRKTSEDYIQLPDNNKQNFEMLGKQLTEYEIQMQKVVDQQKKQEYDLQTIQKLLSHYDNVKIVKIQQFETSNMKEVHGIHLTVEKGKVINFDENQLYKASKQPKKKKGLLDYLTNRVTRYALIYNEYLAFCMRNKKNEFKVCSVSSLSNLFQIYNDKNSTQIRLYFVNKARDQYSMPINKLYNIDNKEQFLIELRKALNKIGLDYSLS